jgi:hypothetical protein
LGGSTHDDLLAGGLNRHIAAPDADPTDGAGRGSLVNIGSFFWAGCVWQAACRQSCQQPAPAPRYLQDGAAIPAGGVISDFSNWRISGNGVTRGKVAVVSTGDLDPGAPDKGPLATGRLYRDDLSSLWFTLGSLGGTNHRATVNEDLVLDGCLPVNPAPEFGTGSFGSSTTRER